jgi:hypothetical protein
MLPDESEKALAVLVELREAGAAAGLSSPVSAC